MTELKYNAAREDVPQQAVKAAAAAIALTNLVGNWKNCDRNTRGVVSVVLTAEGSTLKVNVFGACSPSPCNWGVVKGIAYAENISATAGIAFSAQYDFGFKSTIVTGHLDSGCLILETYDMFKDSSGRSNYYSRAYLCRA